LPERHEPSERDRQRAAKTHDRTADFWDSEGRSDKAQAERNKARAQRRAAEAQRINPQGEEQAMGEGRG
jgi:hypothetical protein